MALDENKELVRRLVEERVRRATRESRAADLAQLEMAPRRWLLLQLTVPLLCVAGYVAWTQSRVSDAPFGDLDFRRDRSALFATRPDNIFLVKASWWLPR